MPKLEELAKQHGRIILFTAEERREIEGMERASKARRDRIGNSKELAIQHLIEAGMLTPDGELHPMYK
jgi:hypothetical protein